MSTNRLLQSGSKRLLESGSTLLLEGEAVGAAVRRSCIASFRVTGPSPDVAAHILVTSRFEKIGAAPTRRPFLFFAGGDGNEASWQGGTSTNPQEVGDAVRSCADLLAYRRRGVSPPTDWTWGDDEMIDRIDAMLDYAEATYGFVGPYHLTAVSMGTPCAMNWAVNNLDRTRSIACMLPAVDLQDIEDNRAPLYPAIVPPSDAYGTSTIPDDHNPAAYASDLRHVPIKLWYSNNDTVCVPSTVTAFAAASGATTVNIGNQTSILPGHGLDSGFTASDVGAFLVASD